MSTSRPGRRTPNRQELEVWRAFVETTEAVRTELGRRLQNDTGLSPGDYVVLLGLSEAPGHRLRSSDLASEIGWERSRLSHHLARMERRDLISREDCATDNRGAEIVLTDAGAAAFRGSITPHFRAIRELFVDALTPDQLVAAGEIARALQARLDRS